MAMQDLRKSPGRPCPEQSAGIADLANSPDSTTQLRYAS